MSRRAQGRQGLQERSRLGRVRPAVNGGGQKIAPAKGAALALWPDSTPVSPTPTPWVELAVSIRDVLMHWMYAWSRCLFAGWAHAVFAVLRTDTAEEKPLYLLRRGAREQDHTQPRGGGGRSWSRMGLPCFLVQNEFERC